MNPDEIELIYELSPMQQAMLFHSLYAPGSGVYVLQTSLRLTGPLDVSAFERAWRHVVARHGILRTAFFWEDLERPLQVVHREVELEVAHQCWCGLDPAGQQARLAEHMEADRERGFDLSHAPLMRLALFELAPGVHQLVWTLHHLLVDGWSQGRLLRELFASYVAFARGEEPRLEPPRGFREYIAWLQQQDLAQAEAFWRRSLAGFSAPTLIAGGDGRPGGAEGPDFRQERRSDLHLSREATEALRAAARRHRLTVNTLVQGAWALLLAQATGRDDVVFGTTVAGRPAELPGVESILGPFINTLPLRVAVRPELPLREWLTGLQAAQAETRRFEHSPLVEVQRWSELPAGSPLFDHLLVFENLALSPEMARPLPDLEIAEEASHDLTNYPLTLVVIPGAAGDGLELSIRSDAGRFDAPEVTRMLERLAGVLAAFAEEGDPVLGEIPLLLAGERHQALVEWNDTWSDFPREACLPELFAAVAREMPEAPAVIAADGEVWSYRRLDEVSNRLARRLQACGVGPETAVGISMERSPELIAGTLAILKAGGIYVPLDAGYPDERLAFMLADTGARTVLVHAPTRERLAGLAEVMPVEAGMDDGDAGPLGLRVPAGCLAYVIYTSGSTGRPKGVGVSHRAIARLVLATDYVDLGPGDRTAHVASISFDAATFEIWGALLTGAAVAIIPREVVLSPSAFAERLRERRVNSLFLTSALFAKMAREVPEAFAGMSELMTGGEPLDPVAIRTVLAGRPPRRLINVYGPTESTTFATWHPLRDVPPEAVSVPIGRPVANTSLFVLDRSGSALPPGVAGELCIGGDGLARGYLNRPELTAERFIPHPWGRGERLYRTGDLVWQRPEGAIEYLGRIDNQVKIRGFRIEPGEIEAVLASHPAVRECAVLARRDTPGETRLVAYAVLCPSSIPGSGREEARSDLRSWLAERLPDYMLPSAFVLLDELPLTANGKVDRRALPAPEQAGSAGEPAEAPADLVEELVAGVWAEVLGAERVGRHDDFFELGGHSLLATQVMSRLRSVLGADLPLRVLFEAPTVAELAAAVRESQGGLHAPPIVPAPREAAPPLSFAQQRLWVMDQLEPGSAAYNVPLAVRLTGEVDPGLLARVFGEVVRRHEALRTTFASERGEPVQVIAPMASGWRPELPVIDLRHLPAEEREARARALAGEEARRPFDLRRGPLLRLGLGRLGSGDWLLLLTMHHIVSDGWSMGVLLREVGVLYEAFAEGRPSPLPELPLQYADFAVWQRSWLQGEVLQAELDHWKRALAGAPRLLELPTDRPRPAVQTFDGASLPVALSPALSQAVAALCRQEGVTPFMALLAAWALLLGRHAGQDDVLLGSPIAGRNRREIEGLIGFFVNTLVLRADLAENPSFSELLGRVRAVALDAFAHQDVPFERLVEELVSERDLAISPLFQALFILQNSPVGELRLPGLALAPVAAESDIAKFDLSIALSETPAGIAGTLEHNTDLFDRSTAERLLGRFTALLEGAVADSGLPVGELPLLLPAELEQLRAGWNDTAELFPADLCVHELIAAQAARTPDAVAVSCGGARLLYGELEERAGRLARWLVRQGVGPEVLVGLCADRTPALLIGMLGVLKAGGAYVPLDPTHPRERLGMILEDAGVPVLVTERALLDALPAHGARAVLLDEEAEDVRVPLPSADPQSLAYVIYTSGSTGRPKGVGVRHGGVVNYLTTMAARPGLSARDVVMAVTTLSFDIAVTELLLPLTVGARVELVGRETAADPALLSAALESSGATVMQATPATWTMLVEGGWAGSPALRALCGGEALPRALADKLLSRVGELWNVYGPTETTVWSTRHRVEPGDRQVPLGLPLGNTTVHLLGRWGELVPPGAAGELLIGGVGLARGYHGRADLTAERFVPDPFGAPGTRLYRTGDLARRLPDGALEYLGRIDFQVKVRGFRIELGEIESVLGAHPEVRECVVVARDGRLVAYVAPRGGEARPGDLRGHLRARLPEYMVPSAFVRLDSFPLTPSGKVDRKALPAPEGTRSEAADYAAPSDPVEELLAGIWAEVLGLDRVGVHDSFFSLGGHSLLATRVVSRLREAFGVEVPLRRLFETPTVAELAKAVRSAQQPEGGQAPVVRVPRDGDLPLSFAQQRLWVIDQLEPGSPAYNIPLAVRLRGDLPEGLLERIFAEIVRRHEALRTTFSSREGRPVQVIAPERVPELPVEDIAHLPAGEREARAREIAQEEARRPFDLQSGPLLRLGLVRLDPGEHLLLVTMHHIVSDAWSIGVLLREIAALYEAFAEGRPSPLAELPVQYADFAVWQRGWLQGDVLRAQLDHWRRALAGAPRVLELPTDRPRPAVQTFRGATRPVALSPALSHAVAALSRQSAATPFMTLLAAWSVLLGRHAGQDDLLVGSPIAGRNRREVEDLIGFFVNTLVLRADLAGSPGFGEVLARVRAAALDAFAHQDVPFERLVEELVSDRDLAVSPLFQTAFTLQNAPGGPFELPGLALTPVETENEIAKFDLSLALGETPAGFTGGLEHNTDLFDAGTAERLLGRFAALLEAAVADPGRPIGDLPLLLPAELEQLLTGWNDTAEPFPADLPIHELIAAQAARTPDAVAVSRGGEQLSYGELDEQAGRLARRLARLGVGPETLVGLCAGRSPALLVGLLGVLKAGGAYVPLDPTHPRERLGLILEDAGISVLITESGLLDALPAYEARAVLLDEEVEDVRLALPRVDPESLAYVIYTSGSTGRPKGVGVRHRGVVNYLSTMAARPGLAAGDVVVAVTTLSFDIAVTELILPLTVGARIELVGRETAGDSALLAAVIESSGATVMQATPATWTMLVEGGWAGSRRLKALCGGEALPRALADKLLSRVGELWNVYGPTETTVWSTRHLVRPGQRQVPLGLPLGNTAVHLLGRWGELVPPGAAGELLIGGAGLARGYHRRPDLTAERFVPDPFGDRSERGGERLYRTGDLARRLPDGTLEYLGRIDFQVKVRGFRIELGEIESVLGGHPEVRECVVVARDGALAAYVVPREAEAARPEDLRGHLRARLPEYMVPSAFVRLEAFPLTPSGKVDRRALPAPDRARRGRDGELVAPRTPAEAALAEMWRELLGLDQVSVDDGFFELGGHSLLATQLRARVRQAFGVDLPLAEIFRHPTVAGLAGVIDAQSATLRERELAVLLDELDGLSDLDAQSALGDPRALLDRLDRRARPAAEEEGAPELAPLPRPAAEDGTVAFPLSFAQQRLWFLDRLEPGNPVYNIPLPVRLQGELPVALLERIFGEIVARHEALRTTFADGVDEPVQVIHSDLRPALPVLDLSHLPMEEREERARQIAQEEAYRPFDLRTGPLLRLTAVRLEERDWLLLVTIHHIVSDGWSMGVMLREIAALFEAFSAGRPSPLPALPIQYADFSVWQRRWLRGRVLEEQLAFWKQRLAGAPAVLELPTDRPRPAVQTYRGAAVARLLAPEVSAAVRELCRRMDVTPFMALLAAWSLLLGRHAGQEDILVGTPVAGRHRQETQDLIGFFVNTLVLRTDLSGGPGFGALLERVSRASLESFIHQDLPFERIVEELVAERDPSHAPLFQVMFAVQNAARHELRLPGLTLAPVAVESRMAKFDLTLTLADGPEGFAGTLEHNTGLFDGSTAARLLARFEVLLAAAAADPGRPVLDLPLLLPEERHQMLLEWNDASRMPEAESFPALFEATARAFPDEPAVITAEGETWSYRRLDEASNRLARKLRALGVGSDRAVGICMERAPELILGVVAVSKAGGVYLPLNPANPDERLLFQLDDTGAGLVLVHRATRERLPGRRRLEVDPEAWSGPRAEGDADPLGLPVPAESLAYIIYTSGSTGLPKGVGVPHGAAMVHSATIVEDDALRPGERVVQFSSLSFDVSIEQMLPTLISGAAVVLRDEELASPDEMLRGFARLGVTSANLPTVYWHQAVQSWTAESAPPEPLRLRVQCVGGEAMLPEAARRWMALAGPLGLRGVRLINGYGPTETVVTATRSTVPETLPPGAASVPIGRTLPFRAAHVVGGRGELQPPGVPGELCLGGVMARGYVNRPELTAEKFVPNPWSSEPGARMYRTGDLVRQIPNGELDYLGRIDRQVKIRGFRIEPGEIEAVLSALPQVRDCAVLARRDTPGETRLVAYVVPAMGASLNAITVRELLRDKLPDYMVPAAVVFLEALPLTPNGKVDRKALPAPDRAAAPEEGFVPPRDEIELRVAAIWEELLDVRPVGLHDNFFALGGHSLLAVRLVGSIERQLGSRIPLAALIAAPTVETIARLVRGKLTLPRSPVVPLDPGTAARPEPPLFLVHPVGGNVFCYLPLARLGGLGVPVYGIQAPDPEALGGAWTLEALAAHHVAALREVRPEGPYRLAGWSLGGAVAFEMARQLTGQGSEVALLAMIDPGPPRQGGEVPDPRLELAQFVHDLRGLAGLDTSRGLALPAGVETLDDLLARAEVRAMLPPDVAEDQVRALFALFRANVRALEAYRPEPFAGRLTLLRAEATAALLPEADREWSALARGGAEVHLLAGDHYSLLRPPHVAALSEVLAASLRGPEGIAPAESAGRLAALSPVKRQLLEALLRERRAAAADAETIRRRDDAGAPVPLSFAQERMWFLHLLDPASSAYNVVNGVKLEGELRPGVLADAFRLLTRRHQVLVTRYEVAGNQPVQVVEAEAPFPLPGVDLGGLPEELRARELRGLEDEEARRPFDLIRGPVMRATLVRLAPAEHVLLLAIHHIAIDGWSLGILIQDLAALYSGLAAGAAAPLSAPPLQYADFAVWQRRFLRGEALEAQLGYWRRQLAPPLPVLRLPTDLPRQDPQPFRSGDAEVILPAGLAVDLLALGHARGASLFMTLLAGLTAVLHRATGDERILVGTPVAGRDRMEIERLVGFFLNNLVLRLDLDGDPGFGALLERAARTALGAFAHQDLPLETLLQELRVEQEGSGARGPFQVMLLLQNVPPSRIEVPGLALSSHGGDWGEGAGIDLGAAIYDLGLTVTEVGGGALRGVLTYNALLFEAATAERLLGQLRVLLEGGVTDPGARLSELPLLSAAEQREVLAWNPPAAAPSGTSGESVPALFAARAAAAPEAEAVRHGGRSLSYGELEQRSRVLAERLHALGAGPEVPVAVFLERSPELIAALLGVLRAGGACVPLDPALSADHLRGLVEDLTPAVLVTDSALATRIPWAGKALFIDGASGVPRGVPLSPPAPEQAAWAMHTSGSAGRPRGVVVHHGALAAFVAAARGLYGIGAGDRVLQLASPGFGAGVEEIWTCLTAGGTLVLRTDEMAGTVAGFLRGCEEHGVTVLDLPTAFWHELAVSPEIEERGLPPAVRAVIAGGERPLAERVASWLRRTGPRVRLFNAYRLTEAVAVATAAELAEEPWREVSLGRPLRSVQAHVVDRALRPVPAGVPGEVLIGGPGVARGYAGRPDLTAERFLPDPFSGIAGARLHRTGDLARRRPDGALEFAGRMDRQVKIRGLRVEPWEIESVLAASSDVGECAVLAREDARRPGDLQLVAWVVPRAGRKTTAADLRAFLESRLPAWMIPAAFVPLGALPRTPAGKVDPGGLPAPDSAPAEVERLFVEPRNEIEEAIAEIWCDALHLERLSVYDGFFELGGHSLLLLQVMRRLRDAFDLEIPLRSIYEERTVAALAKKVEELLIEEIRQLS